ncbi:MAG: hypothetical protein LBP86_06265 [Azoarcus sp.]|jgi:hypothetical protein|nr:hypothetical protein [Azoarcus sp.]
MNPLSRLFSWLAPTPPPDPDTQAGLRRVAELVDKTFPAAADFNARLAAPVAGARAYCAGLVDTLPPAIDLDRQSFAADPRVHALFASADDIGDTVAASAPIRAWLAETESRRSDTFFALLAARRMDKKTLGVAMQGDIVMSDVPQSLLQFSNQMLLLPAATPETARAALLAAAFDSLLRTFAEHVAQVRKDYEALKTERELERIRQRSRPAPVPPFPSRRIAELDERLRRQFASLQPGTLIDALADFLSRPEQALHLAAVELWVTRAGVIRCAGDKDAARIGFMELVSRDRRRHTVLPVRIRCDEAREALRKAREVREVRENILLL